KTQFKLLTVLPSMATKYADGISALSSRTLNTESTKSKESAQSFLDEFSAKFAEKFSKDRISTAIVEGDPGENILKAAKIWPAGVIIRASRGHGDMARLWLGSVSQEVVLQADCPVEVVKR